MNRIVKEHYPVSKLPPELREGLDSDQVVTVTVSIEEPVPTIEELFALRQPPFRSAQDIDGELRRQRNEWDN